MFFLGIQTVELNIEDVIEKINRAARQAKRNEHRCRDNKTFAVKQSTVEDQRRIHQNIFDPLLGAHLDNNILHRRITPSM